MQAPRELDELTIRRAQRGDASAQAAFLRRYVRPLHAFIRRVGMSDEVDDLTQELLQKLLVVLPRFQAAGSATLTTWVFAVAHHWLLDMKKRRVPHLVSLDEGLMVPDVQPSPAKALENKQLKAALEKAITALPEAQRRVFLLAHVHQQPLEVVADVEAVPVGTIKSRLHRARVALAKALAPQFQEGGDPHAVVR